MSFGKDKFTIYRRNENNHFQRVGGAMERMEAETIFAAFSQGEGEFVLVSGEVLDSSYTPTEAAVNPTTNNRRKADIG